MPSIALPATAADRRSLSTNAAAPAAPQLQSRISTSLTDVTQSTAVEIATEIEENISGYLLTITMMNALVGVASGIAMKLCGLGDPILRRPTAFLLNYIPILGPMTGVVIFFLVGIVTFDWPWYAFVPAGIYLLIHIAEGETITPMLLAKRFTLNPVLVIVSLFFWHTIWGIPGALLAVPLLAIFKIVADRIEPLKPIGHIIGS